MIPGLGRSPGDGKGYALHYYGLEKSMDCIVHGNLKESEMTELLSLCFLNHLKIKELLAIVTLRDFYLSLYSPPAYLCNC